MRRNRAPIFVGVGAVVATGILVLVQSSASPAAVSLTVPPSAAPTAPLTDSDSPKSTTAPRPVGVAGAPLRAATQRLADAGALRTAIAKQPDAYVGLSGARDAVIELYVVTGHSVDLEVSALVAKFDSDGGAASGSSPPP